MRSAPQAHPSALRRWRGIGRRLQLRTALAGRRLRRIGPLVPAALTLSLVVKGVHPGLPGWPCPLRTLTGIPCPTCFLTRATAAALCGQLEASVRLHAFGPLCAAGLLAWSLLAFRRRRLLPVTIRPGGLVGLTVALLLYWLARLGLQFGLGVPAFVGLR